MLDVDVGAHKVLAMIADLDGTVVHSVRLPVAPDDQPDARLKAVGAVIAEALAGAKMRADDMWAITIGVTGRSTPASGSPPRLPPAAPRDAGPA